MADVRVRRVTLAVAVGGTLLVMLDFNAPLATLSATAAGLHAGPVGRTWMLAGISVGLASALLVSGALGDDYGRRRVFLAGTSLLAISTGVCALAPDSEVFIVARVVQGVSAAAVLACSLGLIGHAYPAGPGRRRATGVWGASLGAGIAVGPLLAAGIAQASGWRAVYAVRPQPVDVAGVVTLMAGLACLVAGLVEGQQGWGRPMTLTPLLAGAVLLAAFGAVESRRAAPLLDPALFGQPGFVAATIGAFATGLAVIGLMSYLPTVLQRGLAQSPLASAGVLALWSGTSAVAALLARRLPYRLPAGWQLTGGLLLCATGLTGMTGLTTSSTWLRLTPGLVIAGVGSGILNAALARLAVESVPAGRAAMGSGANNTARYLGSGAGVAVVVAVVAAYQPGAHQTPAAATLAGMNTATLLAAGLALLGALTTLACAHRDTTPAPAPTHSNHPAATDTTM
ncbi:MAG: MFS transporter [Pseudonocardiales bacterium]|nr:MAG: MFS transporter [Pseudonocardiales bacterium]